jgi:uncharacterized SAM-binding protein YcdF (DUF218 family)
MQPFYLCGIEPNRCLALSGGQSGAWAMYFVVSKTVGAVLIPSNFLIIVGLAGLLLVCTRYRPLGRTLLILCVAGFVVCGFSPIGNFLIIPLETRFPAWNAVGAAPDGIVVLGGGLDRIFAAAKLARQYPNARVVYSGGNPGLMGIEDLPQADVAEAIFTGLGLAQDRLLLERKSRNTLENAQASKTIASPKSGERWVLVTSAYHMPRSIGIFRKVGFEVEPYPVGGEAHNLTDLLTLNSTFLGRLTQTNIGAREWMGLLAYRLSGATSELLPSPELRNG